MIDLRCGDCLDVMRTLADASVDAVVCDPPAGIRFMGKEWDYFPVHGPRPADYKHAKKYGSIATGPENFSDPRVRQPFIAFLRDRLAEALRVARPGAVLLCWALPRTSHWTGTAIEDAGWIIEDRIAHHFGSGFPKHKSKLKPATEDWWLARKPGPKWLGVEACRVGLDGIEHHRTYASAMIGTASGIYANNHKHGETIKTTGPPRYDAAGRWPPNLALSHVPGPDGCVRRGTRRVKGGNGRAGGNVEHAAFGGGMKNRGNEFGYAGPDGRETIDDYACVEGCPVRLMGEQSGESKGTGGPINAGDFGKHGCYGKAHGAITQGFADSGTAARFFPNFAADADPFLYCPKASRAERNRGCEGMPEKDAAEVHGYTTLPDRRMNHKQNRNPTANHHPTVKPLALMRWLCRLACPPGGVILDPFAGSGSTGVAATQEGFDFVGIEQDPEYHRIAAARIEAARLSLVTA